MLEEGATRRGDPSGGVPHIHRVDLVDIDDDVSVVGLAGEVDGEALDPALAEVDDLAPRCQVRRPSHRNIGADAVEVGGCGPADKPLNRTSGVSE